MVGVVPEKREKKTNKKKSSSDWIVYRSADGGPLFRSRDSCCLLPSIIMGGNGQENSISGVVFRPFDRSELIHSDKYVDSLHFNCNTGLLFISICEMHNCRLNYICL